MATGRDVARVAVLSVFVLAMPSVAKAEDDARGWIQFTFAPVAWRYTGDLGDRVGTGVGGRVGFGFELEPIELWFAGSIVEAASHGSLEVTSGSRNGVATGDAGIGDLQLGVAWHFALGRRVSVYPVVGYSFPFLTAGSGDSRVVTRSRGAPILGGGVDLDLWRQMLRGRKDALRVALRAEALWQGLEFQRDGPGLGGDALGVSVALVLGFTPPERPTAKPPTTVTSEASSAVSAPLTAPEVVAPAAPAVTPPASAAVTDVDALPPELRDPHWFQGPRRPLTLPAGTWEWTWFRFREWPAGRWDGGWALARGITHRVEIGAPLYVRWSLGDREARSRPEIAIGAGVESLGYGEVQGLVLGAGVDVEVRGRPFDRIGWRARVGGGYEGEGRTDARSTYGFGRAGVEWNPRDWVTLGVGAGYITTVDQAGRRREQVILGGQNTPLVSAFGLHLVGGIVVEGRDVSASVGAGFGLLF